MSIESFGRSTYDKTNERLAEVNQSLEGTSEGDEKEELIAEQASINERQQELIDKAHDEAIEEDVTREQGKEQSKEQNTASTEGDEINTRLAELAAEQVYLKQRQQELANESGGEKSVAQEQGQETVPDEVPEKNVVQEQKQEVAPNETPQKDIEQEQEKAKMMEAQKIETRRVAMVEAKRVQEQENMKRHNMEKMQEIRRRLNLSEEEQGMPGKKKESKKEEFERRVEEKRKLIQEKLTLLADPEWAKEMMSYERESGMGEEEIGSKIERLESDLNSLKSYQEMKKRPFWKQVWGDFRSTHEFSPDFLLGTTGALFAGMGEIVLNGISHGGVALLDPTGIGVAALAGVGIGVAVAVGVQTLGSISQVRHDRNWTKERAKDILYEN